MFVPRSRREGFTSRPRIGRDCSTPSPTSGRETVTPGPRSGRETFTPGPRPRHGHVSFTSTPRSGREQFTSNPRSGREQFTSNPRSGRELFTPRPRVEQEVNYASNANREMKNSEFMVGVVKLEQLEELGKQLLVSFQQALEFLRRPVIHETSKLVESILKENETGRVKLYVEAGCTNAYDSALANLDWDSTTYDAAKCGSFMAVIYSMVKQNNIMQERVVYGLRLTTSAEELDSYCLMWSLRPFVIDDVINEAMSYIK
ncbi:hypothetical protein KSS87_014537 [Heliosperma pusillum]|nr:hypothetical protein KSS87_014537 [Heliosperma pusillum]